MMFRRKHTPPLPLTFRWNWTGDEPAEHRVWPTSTITYTDHHNQPILKIDYRKDGTLDITPLCLMVHVKDAEKLAQHLDTVNAAE